MRFLQVFIASICDPQISKSRKPPLHGCQIARYHPEEWMLAPPFLAFQYGGGSLLPALGPPVRGSAHHFSCQLFVKCHKLESPGKQKPPWRNAFTRMARG